LANRGNMSRKDWDDYDRTTVWVQDQRGMLTAARKRARQEAREEAKRIAQRMREHGFDADFIAKITDVSLQEAEALNVRN
jgi:SOS response regulatory protein OraA/RecX